MAKAFYELKCGVNTYPWGKVGQDSLAARLCEKADGYSGEGGPKKSLKIDSQKPYAEMWMGDYPDLPSYIKGSEKSLKELVEEAPEEWLGKSTVDKFKNHDIPYLPKVLSIAKALPLQLHPNKDLAAKLHNEDPQNFTDPNHKPEIALALSDFEAFCGFKPLSRISKLLQLPSLKQFLPFDAGSSIDDKVLKQVVNRMLKADEETIKIVYTELTNTPSGEYGKEDQHIAGLAPRLAEQYSMVDPGILVALLTMNYLQLEAGDSIYIPADGIHAYLAGDIIECMARSNNVLNTGFCPSAERNSADLFCNTLTFKPHSADECMLKPKNASCKTKVYSPPLSEFDVSETNLKPGEKDDLTAVEGSRILIVTSGKGMLKIADQEVTSDEGQSFFVKANTPISIQAKGADLKVHTFYNH